MKNLLIITALFAFTLLEIGTYFTSYTFLHYEAEAQVEAFFAEVTAYSSTVDQTDNDPFITASGERVRKGGIACPNWLEFGDRVEIEGKEYECNDVMNKRYRDGKYFDIWFESRQQALNFGRQRLAVVIVM